MPTVAPPDAEREPGTLFEHGAPPFTRHITLQPRFGGMPFSRRRAADGDSAAGSGSPSRGPIDALSLAFFTDALIPAPFMRLTEPNAGAHDRPDDPLPRADLPRAAEPDPERAVPRARPRRR